MRSTRDREDRAPKERVDRVGHAEDPLGQDHAPGDRRDLELRRRRRHRRRSRTPRSSTRSATTYKARSRLAANPARALRTREEGDRSLRASGVTRNVKGSSTAAARALLTRSSPNAAARVSGEAPILAYQPVVSSPPPSNRQQKSTSTLLALRHSRTRVCGRSDDTAVPCRAVLSVARGSGTNRR